MSTPKTINMKKYIEALNNLLGTDCMYYQGDKDVEAILEVIVAAKELADENKKLKTQLEPFKAKQCFTCLHYGVGEDHMPCYECEDYNKYEWLGGKQQ